MHGSRQFEHSGGRRPGGRPAILILACLVASTLGCAGYRYGADSLFPPDIHTVYVPMFESDSFRRFLGERLTEAVMKEIEQRTNYKVVGSPQADSVLSGRIVDDAKKVLVEDRFDQPREIEYSIVVLVNWTNRKGDLICEPGVVPIPAALAQVSATGMLVPEYGQSVATAQQEAIDKLAQQIVDLMEAPW